MKILVGLTACAACASLLSLGCGPDSGVVEPASRYHDAAATFSSTSYSDWSTPVHHLGPLVNWAAATDQHPVLSKDGRTLYFASNRTEDPAVTADQNIWVARRVCTDRIDPACSWGQPVKLGDAVNSRSLDAAPALSRDEHQLFFTSQRSNGHCSVTPPTIPQCDRDLWVSYREDVHDDLWQPAVNLGAPVNTEGEEVAPNYFANDDAGLPQLFFNDGLIQSGVLVMGDIYMSELSPNGTWSDPLLVEELQTSCSDQRPSISHDGRTLYFHSTRAATAGVCATARIWVSTRQGVSDPWSAPSLVPSPISDVQTIHPFIHSHGKTETLLFVRSGDIWMSERTKLKSAE